MRKILLIAATITIAMAALMILGGCESANKRTMFNPVNRKNIHVIGLIPPDNPQQIVILDTYAKEIGGAFGLIGHAIGNSMTEADMKQRSTIFARSIAEIPFDFRELITEQTENNLTRAGYTVKIVKVSHSNSALFLPSYNDMPVQADAYLDMDVIAVGFVNNPSQYFEPWISLHVRLISPDSKQLFYRDWFLYGKSSDLSSLPYEIQRRNCPYEGKAYELPVSSEYHFENFDELIRKKETAVQGLKIGIKQIAEKIEQNLTVNESQLAVYDSNVYIYRPDVFIENYVNLSITVDDHKIGILKNGRHLFTNLPAGRHVINIKGPKKNAEITQSIDVEKDQSYYIKVELLKVEALGDIGAGKSKVTLVPVDLGRSEVSKTKVSITE